MDIKDFYKLSEEERKEIVRVERTQSMVRITRDQIARGRLELEQEEKNNQERCSHPAATSTYKANENEFGNLTGGGEYRWFCSDCNKRWTSNK